MELFLYSPICVNGVERDDFIFTLILLIPLRISLYFILVFPVSEVLKLCQMVCYVVPKLFYCIFCFFIFSHIRFYLICSMQFLPYCMGRDNSVGIATRYGLDGPGIESRWEARFPEPIQIGPGAHPASYTMSTGSFPEVKRPGRGVDHLSHLAPRLSKE